MGQWAGGRRYSGSWYSWARNDKAQLSHDLFLFPLFPFPCLCLDLGLGLCLAPDTLVASVSV